MALFVFVLLVALFFAAIFIYGTLLQQEDLKREQADQALKEYIQRKNSKLGIVDSSTPNKPWSELEALQDRLKKEAPYPESAQESCHANQESDESRGFVFAGFGLRLGALIVDYLIVGALLFLVFFIYGFLKDAFFWDDISDDWVKAISGLGIFYFVYMESSSLQATLGKRAFGIYVADIYGNRITRSKAWGRNISKIISNITLGIGYIMCLWTDKKQALHDKMAETLVLKR